MADPSAPQDPSLGSLAYGRIGRAYLGSAIALGLAGLLYRMLGAIAFSFASKPVTSLNPTVVNLSAAVRTLVMGIIALGTGVFAIAALGLGLLALTMTWRRWFPPAPAAPDA